MNPNPSFWFGWTLDSRFSCLQTSNMVTIKPTILQFIQVYNIVQQRIWRLKRICETLNNLACHHAKVYELTFHKVRPSWKAIRKSFIVCGQTKSHIYNSWSATNQLYHSRPTQIYALNSRLTQNPSYQNRPKGIIFWNSSFNQLINQYSENIC